MGPKSQSELCSFCLRHRLRERLVAFYKEHNPEKVAGVDKTLDTYKGKEDLLFRKLRERYIVASDGGSVAKGNGPECFLDFKIGTKGVGRVLVKVYMDRTPLAAENFRVLCTGEKGSSQTGKQLGYRSCVVHRVVKDFCIQAGDYTRGDGTGGLSIYPPNSTHGDMWGKFKDETFMKHDRKGLLSMANNGPNRNGSQFFITMRALPHLNGKHVVFGEVIDGMDVVEEISKLQTDARQRPLTRVIIAGCGEIKNGKVVQLSGTARGSQPMSGSTQTTAPLIGGLSTSAAKPFAPLGAANKEASSQPFGQQQAFVFATPKGNPFGSVKTLLPTGRIEPIGISKDNPFASTSSKAPLLQSSSPFNASKSLAIPSAAAPASLLAKVPISEGNPFAKDINPLDKLPVADNNPFAKTATSLGFSKKPAVAFELKTDKDWMSKLDSAKNDKREQGNQGNPFLTGQLFSSIGGGVSVDTLQPFKALDFGAASATSSPSRESGGSSLSQALQGKQDEARELAPAIQDQEGTRELAGTPPGVQTSTPTKPKEKKNWWASDDEDED